MDSGNGVPTISERLDGVRDSEKHDIMRMAGDGCSSHSRSLSLIIRQLTGESGWHG